MNSSPKSKHVIVELAFSGGLASFTHDLCLQWYLWGGNSSYQRHWYSWQRQFLNIKVLLRFNTSLKLWWHCYQDMLQVFVCSTSTLPLGLSTLCQCSQTKACCHWGQFLDRSWSYTLMNITNKQQMVWVLKGKKLLQFDWPGGVLHWNKHRSIPTHFWLCGKKRQSCFLSLDCFSHKSFHWGLKTTLIAFV